MKKFASIILTVAVLCSCFVGVFNVSAQQNRKLNFEISPTNFYTYDSVKGEVTPVKYFDIKIGLDRNSGTAGVEFNFTFDNSLVALKSVTNGNLFSDLYYNATATGCKILAYNSNTEESKQNGTVVTVNVGVRSSVKKADLKFATENAVAFNGDANEVVVDNAVATWDWCSHSNTDWEYIEDENGNYTGEAKFECAVCHRVFDTRRVVMPSLSQVNWTIPTQFYTGKAITPAIAGTYYSEEFGRTLTLSKDVNYKIASVSNNKNVGTAYISLTSSGCKGYRGVKNLEFSIVKPSVKLSETSYTYNGKSKTPSAIVKVGKTTLKNGTDYTLSYKNNKNPGKATVSIIGKGKYAGTYTASFIIKPKAPTLKTYKSTKKKSLTVSVSKTSTVSGYEFQVAKNKSFTSGKKAYTSKSYKTYKTTFSKLSSKKYYYVRVRSYKTVGSTKYYGSWCSVKRVKVK